MEGTVRVYTCLDCGTVTKATIVVNLRALLGLCKNNKKVTAIKLHRFNTGAGLREAKDFIEELMKYE
jgi:ribosomal protein L7/L12